MGSKTGMDGLTRDNLFSKEDKGGRVLCFHQTRPFLWFFS